MDALTANVGDDGKRRNSQHTYPTGSNSRSWMGLSEAHHCAFLHAAHAHRQPPDFDSIQRKAERILLCPRMSALPCPTTAVFHLFCGMWRRSRTALGELTENRIIAAARSARRAQVRGICAAGGCGGCAEARQVSGATGRQGIGGGVWLLVGGPRESGDGRGGCTSGFLQHRYTISCLANLLLASAIKAGQDKVREHKLLQ